MKFKWRDHVFRNSYLEDGIGHMHPGDRYRYMALSEFTPIMDVRIETRDVSSRVFSSRQVPR